MFLALFLEIDQELLRSKQKRLLTMDGSAKEIQKQSKSIQNEAKSTRICRFYSQNYFEKD